MTDTYEIDMIDTYETDMTNINNYKVISTIFVSSIWTGILSVFGYTLINAFLKRRPCIQSIFDKIKNNTAKKEVIIIRGVPGIGKTTFVKNYEKNYTNGYYATVSFNEFFIENGTYCFQRQHINRAKSHCLNQFINYLDVSVSRIYITDINHQKWMYVNYINIAKKYGYNVTILDFICNNINELKYFNKRSTHNIPLNYSKKVYNEWEYDINAIRVEPYVKSCIDNDENNNVTYNDNKDSDFYQYKHIVCTQNDTENIEQPNRVIIFCKNKQYYLKYKNICVHMRKSILGNTHY